MTKGRDPLGKRALFSGGPAAPGTEQRKRGGPFDVTVRCSSCDARRTVSPPELILQHLPVWAWNPLRRDSHFMRCPACKRLSWHAVSRA